MLEERRHCFEISLDIMPLLFMYILCNVTVVEKGIITILLIEIWVSKENLSICEVHTQTPIFKVLNQFLCHFHNSYMDGHSNIQPTREIKEENAKINQYDYFDSLKNTLWNIHIFIQLFMGKEISKWYFRKDLI